jgi:hypothetical protein
MRNAVLSALHRITYSFHDKDIGRVIGRERQTNVYLLPAAFPKHYLESDIDVYENNFTWVSVADILSALRNEFSATS